MLRFGEQPVRLELKMSKYRVEIPMEYSLNLVKFILESNNFEFNVRVYRQKLGTAIGIKFAALFANIFMGSFERSFLETRSNNSWVW